MAEDGCAEWRRISCEIRALRAGDLAAALDEVLRAVVALATLAEAVLEACAVCLAEPATPRAPLVQGLARDLWSAGLPVSFGPSWTPAPGADIAVGARGLEVELEHFLREHPAWQLPTCPR